MKIERLIVRAAGLVCCLFLSLPLDGASANPVQPAGQGTCARTVKADIVALEQSYLLNRFSAYVPGGMLFALRSDVVSQDGGPLEPGHVELRADKRPRPLVLRVNEGDCLEVRLTNLMSPTAEPEGGLPADRGGRLPAFVGALAGSDVAPGLGQAQKVSLDQPRTRAASFHVTGLEVVPMRPEDCPIGQACGGDGSNVGLPGRKGIVFNPATDAAVVSAFNRGSLAAPGQTVVSLWRADHEGAYFAYSAAAPIGGEGDGGQIGLGLFASVNVEPKGATWYRSQVAHDVIEDARNLPAVDHHPYSSIDYDRTELRDGRTVPVLALLDADNNIVHSDLNAIIVPPASAGPCDEVYGSSCARPFREFTVIFHDEVHAAQAFSELEDENNPLHLIKDGMGINYGVSSMGSLLMSTPQMRKVGVAKNCPECRAEEFFLSSWANGDPALILKYGDDGIPVGARYPDDPSNVHHSYIGDPVRFRNLHAGPKETHVFHLHAHQWMFDAKDKNSTYLDSQTISPGATFSYEIEFGGGGNRNFTPGDSIFHCHLYPHFAQGMWELWRQHDTFSDGRPGVFHADQPVGPGNQPDMGNLPDGEIANGTETPALVPLPGSALAPMPTKAFRGYPFYIPGSPGHRPPQPALDFDVSGGWNDKQTEPDEAKIVDGGLPRHVVQSGETVKALDKAIQTGGEIAQVIAKRVVTQNPQALSTLAGEWKTLSIRRLGEAGEPSERDAMKFHEGDLNVNGLTPVVTAPRDSNWWPGRKGYKTNFAATLSSQPAPSGDAIFYVNGLPRASGAPYANPCPANAPLRTYRAAFIQTELVYNKHGWLDPQGRIAILEDDIKDVIDPDHRSKLPEPLFFRANSGECIEFNSSNFVPSALNADDFQIYTPTDTIGQHIHLVKFDVTASDGSGNGYNYEDATFSPQEVRDRIFAYNRTPVGQGGPSSAAERLKPKTHPLFLPGGDIYDAAQIYPSRYGALLAQGTCVEKTPGETDDAYEEDLRLHHRLCGAQRTTQRWWADPILNRVSGKDNTLRTVFTHDHMGPSSHQQHGLYAGLVIEPANSVWTPVGSTLTATDLETANANLALKCGSAMVSERSTICARMIGGSNLAMASDPSALAPDPIEGRLEPRAPLKLRSDGGPTATLANIISPECIGDSNSSPLQPDIGRNPGHAAACTQSNAHDTKREFALAIADFGIAYNAALEPINPEALGDSAIRDTTFLRLGRRHVATTPARPLAISSEDPGSQYFNYRHEPLALRLSDWTVDPSLGGWNYQQSDTHADLTRRCQPGDQYCLGDPANAFSTGVHAKRDELLAKTTLQAEPSQAYKSIFAAPADKARLQSALASVETWRRNFNCALYPEYLMSSANGCPENLQRLEPWRMFGDPATPILPAFEGDPVTIRLVQGAQEAQHIFTMNGMKWHRLPGDAGGGPGNLGSGFTNAQPVGISEHFEFNVLVNQNDVPMIDYLFFGSSVDQLWDGLWGMLRSFPIPRPDRAIAPVQTSAGPVLIDPDTFLATLSGIAPPAKITTADKADVCAIHPDGKPPQHRFFDVSAVRACDLFDSCASAHPKGIDYNRRLGIADEKALVWVLDGEGACPEGDACENHRDEWHRRSNASVMAGLRSEFSAGRKLEPLVMRASAGQCLHVNLRNHLPVTLDDGPVIGADGKPREVNEARAYHNFLPMITDGFNVNQYRMSSSVGLSAPRVAQDVLEADGSNIGLNAAQINSVIDAGVPGGGFDHEPEERPLQGSLVPPCTGQIDKDGSEEDRCKLSYTWSATDFQSRDDGPGNLPVEFGALPLRDFGDPVKHPMHGLVGALVIGPAGSKVCASNGFTGAVSANICNATGDFLYTDHVLVMQDAVNATRGGMPVPNLSGAEEPDDYGIKAINYTSEPLWARTGGDPSIGFSDRNLVDESQMMSSGQTGSGECEAKIAPLVGLSNPCDPETPILQAAAGDTIRLNIVHPGGHTRQQGLNFSGHNFNPYPWSPDSHVLEAENGSGVRQGVFNSFGPMMGITLETEAGGKDRYAMDYLYRSQASFLFDGGLWGILRVEDRPSGTSGSSH